MNDKPVIHVDALAQEIRRVDGNHSIGAGALAEALMPFIEANRHTELEIEKFNRETFRLLAKGNAQALGEALAECRTLRARIAELELIVSAPRGTDAQILKERGLTCDAALGAIMFGGNGSEPPPADAAWLQPFYNFGKHIAELEAAAVPDRSSDTLRIDWCVRVLEGIKQGGREKLGDAYPEVLQVIGALKRVLEPNIDDGSQAVPVQAIPGWQWVPVALPEAIRDVLIDRFEKARTGAVMLYRDIWADLLSAAPTPPSPQAEPTALQQILRCRYSVCKSINPDGHAWDIGRLNEVISDIEAAQHAQAEPPQLSALQQYDLERSPEYQKGRADGRAVGYDVGYRYAKEQLTQPTQDADSREAERVKAAAVWVRDGIADFIADNWPDRKHTLNEIADGIKAIEINPAAIQDKGGDK